MSWTGASAYQYIEIEKAILKVLIEKQGLSAKVKYKIWGKEDAEYIIEQYEEVFHLEKGFVYLIRNKDLYKIGITQNLDQRMSQLKPDEIISVLETQNYDQIEKDLHQKYKDVRVPQTEYFRLTFSQATDCKMFLDSYVNQSEPIDSEIETEADKFYNVVAPLILIPVAVVAIPSFFFFIYKIFKSIILNVIF